MFTLHNGDCLQVLPSIPSGSIDAIITDLPYGTTGCKWDSIISLPDMWREVKRVLKPKGVFVTTASQPFTSILVVSNLADFKYEWIWQKAVGSNFAVLKYQPMKEHESILVFSSSTHNYYPIKEARKGSGSKRLEYGHNGSVTGEAHGSQNFEGWKVGKYDKELRNPSSVQYFNNREASRGLHPTQKPTALYEYLIKTYTNEGETVLDIAMGSGTTIEAAERTGRNSIGIEKDEGIFQSAVLRLKSYTPSNNRMHLTAFGASSAEVIPLQSNLFAEVPAAKLGGK
jgi:site-specific DNA-methyltransferase (adenine-specific)